jgi:hypothetical protein
VRISANHLPRLHPLAAALALFRRRVLSALLTNLFCTGQDRHLRDAGLVAAKLYDWAEKLSVVGNVKAGEIRPHPLVDSVRKGLITW